MIVLPDLVSILQVQQAVIGVSELTFVTASLPSVQIRPLLHLQTVLPLDQAFRCAYFVICAFSACFALANFRSDALRNRSSVSGEGIVTLIYQSRWSSWAIMSIVPSCTFVSTSTGNLHSRNALTNTRHKAWCRIVRSPAEFSAPQLSAWCANLSTCDPQHVALRLPRTWVRPNMRPPGKLGEKKVFIGSPYIF